MNNKKQVYYTIYKYNDFNSDFEYVKEYNNISNLKNDNIIRSNLKHDNSIYMYITTNIDNIKKKIQNKYIIIKEVDIL